MRGQRPEIERQSLLTPLVKSMGVKAGLTPITAGLSIYAAHLTLQISGAEDFGIVTLCTSLAALLPFADLGLSAVVVNAVARRDQVAPEPMIRLAWTALWCTCIALCLASIVLGAAQAWTTLLGIQQSAASNRDITIMVILFALSVPLGLGARIANGMNAVHMSTLLSGLYPVTQVLALLVLRQLGAQAFPVICVPAVAQLVVATSQMLFALRRGRPWVRAAMSRLTAGTREGRASLFTTAGPMLVVTLGLTLAFQTDRLLLSHRADSKALLDYSIAMILYTPTWALLSTAALSLWPRFATQSGDKRQQEFTAALATFALLGFLSALAMVIVGNLFTSLWAGQTVEEEMWIALGALVLVQSAHLPAGMILTGPRGLSMQARCVVVMTATNLVLGWLLTPGLGSEGPILASALSVTTCQLYPCIRRVLRDLRSSREQAECAQGMTLKEISRSELLTEKA